jgi:hypothetical protein
MAERRLDVDVESPTLPLPPPRVALEDLIAATLTAAQRAQAQLTVEGVVYRPPLWCGFILDPQIGAIRTTGVGGGLVAGGAEQE